MSETKPDYQRFEDDMNEACERTIAAGIGISDSSGFGLTWTETDPRYQARGGCVCPLGAMLLDRPVQGCSFERLVGDDYGMNIDEVECFWRVFDGGRDYARDWTQKMGPIHFVDYIDGPIGDVAVRMREKYICL